ncbi:hypothetical protein L2E82_18063 [Cichorium intybus]|uniref:Uncharacterized protein n=1 Tax=Cichorium intybus TaxID=13427 RepID=A0ACB9F9I7_CICIN|nr:hypothetical protein L2E82_18063 [Cichorium intybus]
MAGRSSAVSSNSTTTVRIVVAGDRGTGKSSLIVTAAGNDFPANVPPVLPPTRLQKGMVPVHWLPERVPVDVIDTSARLVDELKSADVVLLTYAFDKPSTVDRLSTFWLPELRRLDVRLPIILVGCKMDLNDEQQSRQALLPLLQQFQEIEMHLECSAFKHIYQAVLYPEAPIFDKEAKTLKPRCVRALKRIFILFDHDKDGALSDAEFNDYGYSEGVNENGITLTGFLSLHFISGVSVNWTWNVLRKFGYNNDIRLSDELLPHITRTPDQDGALNEHELEDLFSTAPENPWSKAPYANTIEKNALGGVSLDGFLSQWALMINLDPVYGVENLIYIGYFDDPSSTIRVITYTNKLCTNHGQASLTGQTGLLAITWELSNCCAYDYYFLVFS